VLLAGGGWWEGAFAKLVGFDFFFLSYKIIIV
jgi:hypothetical protein